MRGPSFAEARVQGRRSKFAFALSSSSTAVSRCFSSSGASGASPSSSPSSPPLAVWGAPTQAADSIPWSHAVDASALRRRRFRPPRRPRAGTALGPAGGARLSGLGDRLRLRRRRWPAAGPRAPLRCGRPAGAALRNRLQSERARRRDEPRAAAARACRSRPTGAGRPRPATRRRRRHGATPPCQATAGAEPRRAPPRSPAPSPRPRCDRGRSSQGCMRRRIRRARARRAARSGDDRQPREPIPRR